MLPRNSLFTPVIRCLSFKPRLSAIVQYRREGHKMHLVSKTETFAKLFFLLSFSGILMYIVLAFYSLRTTFNTISKSEHREVQKIKMISPKRFSKDLKYILLWTIPELRYNLTTVGQKLFIDSNCSFKNCYLTTNKSLLNNDVSNFHSIVFSINTLKNWVINMPRKRSPKQKYVFYSMFAAEKFPICNIKADGFFNWTWTYKLYSDVVTPFIEVRDENGRAVAPIHGTSWNDSIDSRTFEVEENRKPVIVGTKTKALMWYMTKCEVDKKMAIYIRQLKAAMKEHFLDFDIFGCGFKRCPNGECLKTLERDYYFYLALEDVFSEDYVTTEVLKGYHHNAVPVVVGGADYLKFLPFNSYVEASHEEVEQLAATLHYMIHSPSTYKSFFTWRNHYTINEVRPERGYCDLCTLLNDKKLVERKSVYESFRSWWYEGPLKDKCFPKGAERLKDVLSYIKTRKR